VGDPTFFTHYARAAQQDILRQAARAYHTGDEEVRAARRSQATWVAFIRKLLAGFQLLARQPRQRCEDC
jgi:plasmid stabilization system protein ParE